MNVHVSLSVGCVPMRDVRGGTWGATVFRCGCTANRGRYEQIERRHENSRCLRASFGLLLVDQLAGAAAQQTEFPFKLFRWRKLRAAGTRCPPKLLSIIFTLVRFNTAVISLAEHRAAAMMVASDLFFLRRRTQIVTLSARYALPTMHDRPDYVVAGGLMSYGSDRNELFRQAGRYAGRILKGEKPAELPVQQATKFELVINLQTAKALELTIPATLLARADDVIE